MSIEMKRGTGTFHGINQSNSADQKGRSTLLGIDGVLDLFITGAQLSYDTVHN